MPHHLHRALALVLVLAAAAHASTARAQTGGATAPLVQGSFSLTEPYDAAAPAALSAVAIETQAALMLASNVTLTETTATLNATPTHGEVWQLCEGEAFAEQPAAAFCSGTLIAPNVLLTADHCVPNRRLCNALAVVFDYRYTSPGVLAPLERDDVYGCQRIVVSDRTADYAVIELDRDVVGRTPAAIHYSDPRTCLGVSTDERVWAAGFPAGVPLKLDLGDMGADALPLGVEVSEDNVTRRQFFRARFDLFAGMDGGGVFNEELQLVGFLALGRPDFERTDTGCYTATTVSDSGSELAGHVIQPLVHVCRATNRFPTLCPATVGRCPPEDAVNGTDAGMRAFPPSDGCGCRIGGARGNPYSAHGWLAVLALSALVGRRLRRR